MRPKPARWCNMTDQRTIAQIREEHARFHHILSEAQGLVDALQIILHEFSACRLDRECQASRRALIATGDGLARLFRLFSMLDGVPVEPESGNQAGNADGGGL